MKNKNKKLVSLFMTMAVASASLVGVASFTGCGDEEEDAENTYYVSTEGSLTATGTKADPYSIDILTDSKVVKAGVTIKVLAGTYNLKSCMRLAQKGNSRNPIKVVAADSSAKTVLDFSYEEFASTNRGIQIDGNYWYWDGIDITGAGDNGMYIGGSYNTIVNCEFYNNRDTGLQLGRSYSDYTDIAKWPSYNLIKNCTSYNNYDNETYGENADGFAAKLTVGYGNVFDGCIAYRNADDGWDLYAKSDSGNIGAVIIYNCVAFENGFLMETQEEYNARFEAYNEIVDADDPYSEENHYAFHTDKAEDNTKSYMTRDGDGNGFKLGGSVMEGEVFMYNCLSFNNRMHGVTDNSNPGFLSLKNITSYNNGAVIDNDSTSTTFGEVVYTASTFEDPCSNIDLARHDYSYNSFSNILSAKNGTISVGADRYRGDAEYSLFGTASTGTTAYKIGSNIDSDCDEETLAGTATTAPDATAIFAQLPVEKSSSGYTYNLSGKENYNIDSLLRNSDGSINMGDILKITDQSKLIDGQTIGSDLTKSSWDEYEHYFSADLYKSAGPRSAVMDAIKDTLYIATNQNATYQDFQVLTKMMGANISWKSSNPDILSVGNIYNTSVSNSEYVDVTVYRPSEDTVVTLTATIVYMDKTSTMTFDVNVKADNPSIGTITVEGLTDGRIILDQYEMEDEPAITVTNASDYNGKLLTEGVQYTVSTKYEYATSKTAPFNEVSRYTSSLAGVYRITKTVSMGTDSKSFTYLIYLASKYKEANFVDDSDKVIDGTIGINKNGYTISGNLDSVMGKLYTVAVYDSEADKAPKTVEELITMATAQGNVVSFRNDTISEEFAFNNNAKYTVYYAITNAVGDVDSTTKLQKQAVGLVEISTVAEFKSNLLTSSAKEATIYSITKDLDFKDETLSSGSSLSTLINGNGHTLSNITLTSEADKLGLWTSLNGGTLMNVKFDNVSITTSSSKKDAALFVTSAGGYIYNLQINNIKVSAGSRVGAIIAEATSGDTYIENVSINNTTEGYGITGTDAGGIVGLIQDSDGGHVGVYIKTCLVNANIGATDNMKNYAGGIVGRYSDRVSVCDLEVENCIFTGNIYAATYSGGIIGAQQNGEGRMRVTLCLNAGSLYYNSNPTAEVVNAQKNCSGIIGRYNDKADTEVKYCFAKFVEYCTSYDVDTVTDLTNVNIWLGNMYKFDYEDTWQLIYQDNDSTSGVVVAPYITLKFIETTTAE